VAENLFDLTGKAALVTGGNSGLGLGFANGLARAGADVIIWGRDESKNEAALRKLRAHGTHVEATKVDVCSEAQVIEATEKAVAVMGKLDCVIANAGFVTQSPFIEMDAKTYHALIDTNQHGAFYTLREAARHMVARANQGRPGGSLILCGSLSIYIASKNLAHYGMSKGALNSLSKAMAVELGEHGIRVNTIAVGLTITEMMEKNMETARPFIERRAAQNPLGRVGRPEDMEGIVVYLASDMSAYHSGDTITIDGGHRASSI
jgi:NAD(P)-dependent dehydrogenase (short-subunit alcohol dehydrogenase family)